MHAWIMCTESRTVITTVTMTLKRRRCSRLCSNLLVTHQNHINRRLKWWWASVCDWLMCAAECFQTKKLISWRQRCARWHVCCGGSMSLFKWVLKKRYAEAAAADALTVFLADAPPQSVCQTGSELGFTSSSFSSTLSRTHYALCCGQLRVQQAYATYTHYILLLKVLD